jgi:hypothetical protein
MNSSAELFKKNLDKAFSQPGVEMNSSTLKDNMKYKQSFKEEKIEGGLADGMSLGDLATKHKIDVEKLTRQFIKGIKVEMEHTKNKLEASEIAMDHLYEDPNYYVKLNKIENKEENKISPKKQFSIDLQSDPDFIEFKKRAKYKNRNQEYSFGTPNVTGDDPYISKRKYSRPGKEETLEATGSGSAGAFEGPLFGGDSTFIKKSQSETPKLKEALDIDVEKVEAKEATTSGSVGGYESPSMWAKSTKKKDWGPSRKTQVPGGSFVKVKKKCTKFPYCNQGDINALQITKNESVKEAIKRVSKKFNISENVIANILEHEYTKNKKGNK